MWQGLKKKRCGKDQKKDVALSMVAPRAGIDRGGTVTVKTCSKKACYHYMLHV
jgi:hypothetical protein